MKTVICDCCGERFQYGDLTAKTDGNYTSVKLGNLTARVSIDVKARLGLEHADICPDCRIKAIQELLGESISRHPQRRPDQHRLRDAR